MSSFWASQRGFILPAYDGIYNILLQTPLHVCRGSDGAQTHARDVSLGLLGRQHFDICRRRPDRQPLVPLGRLVRLRSFVALRIGCGLDCRAHGCRGKPELDWPLSNPPQVIPCLILVTLKTQQQL